MIDENAGGKQWTSELRKTIEERPEVIGDLIGFFLGRALEQNDEGRAR